METNPRDLGLAHLVVRVGYGVNIALHGLTRIPKFSEFAAQTQHEFAATILPPALVNLSCYGIVAMETVTGLRILFGLWTRVALVGNGALLWILLFGTCLVQNWNVAGSQLIYLGVVGALLATLRYNHFSLDQVLAKSAISQ